MNIKQTALLFLSGFTFFTHAVDAKEYTLHIFTTPAEQKTMFDFIAQQRIEQFKGYPYLYDGNMDFEYNYLNGYVSTPKSAFAIAFWQDQPVALITGMPLYDFNKDVPNGLDAFKQAGLNAEEYYYFGEFLILPEHRDDSLISKLAAIFEDYVASIGYTKTCFMEESNDSHPLKPADYQEKDYLLLRDGYKKTSAVIGYTWPTFQLDGSIKEQTHDLNYWIKDLK